SCVFLSFASGSLAQLRSGAASAPIASQPLRVAQVAANFYVISNQAANLVLVVREDASFVAGVQRPELVRQAIATLQELKAPPVKYALLIDTRRRCGSATVAGALAARSRSRTRH